MSELTFDVVGAETAPLALVPTIELRLRIDDPAHAREPDVAPVQSVQLHTQIRIEPERRRYAPEEEELLLGLFGVPERWGETLQPFLWTHVTTSVRGFTDQTEVTLPVECSYDLEVSTGQYLHALRDGEVPLILLFSGTVFRRGPAGTTIEQIPWEREARYRMPVSLWRSTMDTAFPDSGWLRLRRETLDRLLTYKSRHALPTFDATLAQLLDEREVGA